jgi:hypothetical protein
VLLRTSFNRKRLSNSHPPMRRHEYPARPRWGTIPAAVSVTQEEYVLPNLQLQQALVLPVDGERERPPPTRPSRKPCSVAAEVCVCARTARSADRAKHGLSCRGYTRIKGGGEDWTERARRRTNDEDPRRLAGGGPLPMDGRPLVGAVPPCLATPVVFAEPFLSSAEKAGEGASPRQSEPRPVRRLRRVVEGTNQQDRCIPERERNTTSEAPPAVIFCPLPPASSVVERVRVFRMV